MREYVIEIKFVDRFGLGFEVFEIIKNKRINLLATEAFAHEGMALKLESPGEEHISDLITTLKGINGVTEINFRQHLRCEEREHELRTILNSVSEGVVAINGEGRITHINEMACLTIHCSKDKVMGESIEAVLGVKTPLQETIELGQPYKLKEVKLNKDRQVIHFLSSGVPVLDETGRVIGAVATVKDYRHVEEIISKVGRKGLTTFEDIIYQSPNMKRVIETAKTVAKSNSTILLRGESGTGKELFARAMHLENSRSQAPFIAINCGALPDSLLESELFGYEEGAFTGAVKGGKKGLFEQANGGTLFLDEIGEISPQVQVRLLRVLQEGTIRRVGGAREFNVDVRIIAATHRNLEEMIQRNEFREDLYYRLNVIPLRIPPLRKRIEDIPLIAQHLVRKICLRLNRPEVCLTQQSLQFLMNKDWRGNVRQLENVLERVINVMDISHIRPEDFEEWSILPLNSTPDSTNNLGFVPESDALPGTQEKLADGPRGQIVIRKEKAPARDQSEFINIQIPLNGKTLPLKSTVNEIEKQILLSVLEKYPSSRKAGKVLGVSGTTILNKMNSYGIELNQEEGTLA
ncbi:MAG TPA: sigma 54-interacting transcriptional regulator [Candidatus Deferrimicrobium sp.]|nr:sigma 54-interacting transcriptional regulator [Candidatus Deferrimicrobium sp.]